MAWAPYGPVGTPGSAASSSARQPTASGSSRASCRAMLALEEWPTRWARPIPRWRSSARQWAAWSAMLTGPGTRLLPA